MTNTDDIVKSLRDIAIGKMTPRVIALDCMDAADEIEILQATVVELQTALMDARTEITRLERLQH